MIGYVSLTTITRDSIENYSCTTCVHCNDLYFKIWRSIKNIKERSEETLQKIFKKKCERCIDADKIRSKLIGYEIDDGDHVYNSQEFRKNLNFLGMTRRGI